MWVRALESFGAREVANKIPEGVMMQMCFRYCSLFPRGYMFEKDKLVSMWDGFGVDSATYA